jgi:hypothetical protein
LIAEFNDSLRVIVLKTFHGFIGCRGRHIGACIHIHRIQARASGLAIALIALIPDPKRAMASRCWRNSP